MLRARTSCSAANFAKRATPALPATLRPALEPVLATIQELTTRIRAYDREIERLAATKYSTLR